MGMGRVCALTLDQVVALQYAPTSCNRCGYPTAWHKETIVDDSRDHQRIAHGVCSCGWTSAETGGHDVSHLHIESPKFHGTPHIWIQWKGTDVCCDIHCRCGTHLHYDGDFMYFVRCSECHAVWEIGTHVAMYEVLDGRADRAIIQDVD